jgi:pyridoxine 5-phosphate synthase
MSHPQFNPPRLGVNLDHVATLRQLRGTPYPSILEAAELATAGGAGQITVHLREDRRHIQDQDVKDLREALKIPLNLEMAATAEMSRFAAKIKPDWVCIVPEKRKELTTEGGLDLKKGFKNYSSVIKRLKANGIRVSLFIEPSVAMVRLSHELKADAVELHTGKYCTATQSHLAAQRKKAATLLRQIELSGLEARKLGLGVHAGHGFDFENVRPVAALEDKEGHPLFAEYNIGHAIICRAALVGMERAVREMLSAILAP